MTHTSTFQSYRGAALYMVVLQAFILPCVSLISFLWYVPSATRTKQPTNRILLDRSYRSNITIHKVTATWTDDQMASNLPLPQYHQYSTNYIRAEMLHRFMLWTRSLVSNQPMPLPMPGLTSWNTSRCSCSPKMIEPSRTLPETAHDQASPILSALKQGWTNEVAQLSRISFINAVASLAILFLVIMLTILWHADPNPCKFDSVFYWSQNTICIVLGILLGERYLNAIGVPGVIQKFVSVFVTGLVYLGYWHMRVKACRGR